MKVAVSSTGNSPDSPIDQRFGRCRYFIIVDTDDMDYTAIANTNADLSTSAGIQSASLVASTGAEVIITGNCGPKAVQALATTNIKMILGQHGVVRDAVEQFKKGKLHQSSHVNPAASTGAPPSLPASGFRRPGTGKGMARGMGGCGGGMGMGRGCHGTYGTALNDNVDPTDALSPKEELDRLMRQADTLNKQMAAIQARIKKLV